MYPPAQYIATTTAGGVSPGLQVSGRLLLLGFSMTNTSTTALGSTDVIDGTSSGGVQLFRVNTNPSESTREWFGPMGIACEQGLFVSRVAGSVLVTCFYIPETWVADAEGFAYPARVG